MLKHQCYLQYGLERIPFTLEPRKSTTYRLRIKVHPDCRIVVQAPPSAPEKEIFHAIKKRTRWIYNKLNHFKKQQEHISPRYYVSGESHYYLGKQYLLKIFSDSIPKEEIKLLRGKLEVRAKARTEKHLKALMLDWYKDRAREVFNRRLDVLLPQTRWITERPPIRLQTMQTQWGSCSPSGRLTLNPHLIKAPRECIDYVILHELCHLAEHNHSDKFYRLIKQIMPKWEIIKEKLDGMASMILNSS